VTAICFARRAHVVASAGLRKRAAGRQERQVGLTTTVTRT
jgi:hypothetical protein